MMRRWPCLPEYRPRRRRFPPDVGSGSVAHAGLSSLRISPGLSMHLRQSCGLGGVRSDDEPGMDELSTAIGAQHPQGLRQQGLVRLRHAGADPLHRAQHLSHD